MPFFCSFASDSRWQQQQNLTVISHSNVTERESYCKMFWTFGIIVMMLWLTATTCPMFKVRFRILFFCPREFSRSSSNTKGEIESKKMRGRQKNSLWEPTDEINIPYFCTRTVLYIHFKYSVKSWPKMSHSVLRSGVCLTFLCVAKLPRLWMTHRQSRAIRWLD